MKIFKKFLTATVVVAIVGFPAAAMAADTNMTVTKDGNVVTAIASGDTIKITSSSPIDTSGSISQLLASVWSKESLQLTDPSSIVLPDGWTLEYTTDSETWSATVPGDLTTSPVFALLEM